VRESHAEHQRRPNLYDIGAGLWQALGQLEPERAAEWGAFLDAYRSRLREEGMPLAERRALQDSANPCYIPRNALMQDAIKAAEAGSFEEVRVPSSVILGEEAGWERAQPGMLTVQPHVAGAYTLHPGCH